MAHNINTYIGRQAAWHKLGTVTGTFMTWDEIQAHGLNFVPVKQTRRIVYLAHILTTHPSNAVLRKLKQAVEAFDHKHEDERTRNLIHALFDKPPDRKERTGGTAMIYANCPNCGKDCNFSPHSGYSTEPHGEIHWDEWLTCDGCGAITTDAELDHINSSEHGK